MVTVINKHQTFLALFAVAFATLLIAGAFASVDNSIFARKNTQASQSIAETCDHNQKAPVQLLEQFHHQFSQVLMLEYV